MNTITTRRSGGLLAFALAGAIALAACQTTTTRTAGQARAAGTAAPLPTRAVTPVKNVAVEGVLDLATPLITAAFASNGKVTAIYVTPGQKVQPGALLAEIDRTDLDNALNQAVDQLALKELNVSNSLAPATQRDIDSAKSALASAWSAYNEVVKGPADSTVQQALRAWNQAKNSLYSSQLSRDSTCGITPGSTDEEGFKNAMNNLKCQEADRGVKGAELRERSAYQKYLDAQAPATEQARAQAWSAVVQAQSSLATVERGATAEDRAVYDLQIKQARVAVDRARQNLENAKLLSPCACVVQSVSLSVGALAAGNIALVDPSHLKMRTTNLGERDMVGLVIGQPAIIRLKAVTDTLTGTLQAVLPMSSGTLGSAALYTAIIDVNAGNAQLLPGMTGQAEIQVK